MLDLNLIRENPDHFKDVLGKRGYLFDTKKFKKIDNTRKKTQTLTEELQQEKNILTKEYGLLKKDGLSTSNLDIKLEKINTSIEENEKELSKVLSDLHDFMLDIPNVPSDDTPIGENESDNEVVKTHLEPKSINSKSHEEISKNINFELSQRLSGSRYSVLSGPIAKLHRVLVSFMIENAINNEYEEFYLPYIVNEEMLVGTGQLPKFEEDLFKLENGQFLIPTSEVPLTNLMRDKIILSTDLPLKFTSHTPCFRSEAGSYGKDTKGLMRLHQFDKVELVQIVHPDDSNDALEELTKDAESILELLELPFRTVKLCTGDLGFSATKTYDLEVWVPSQNNYREISSCSNCLDFQTKRMKMRFKENGNTVFPHSLNGSALAIGRTILSIIENNFDEKNSLIHIPKAIQDSMKAEYIEV